jgi:hypothetical protein
MTADQNRSSNDPWEKLPHRWLHIDLPGYREHEVFATYSGFSLDELPPIPIQLDEDCEWLLRHGASLSDGLHRHERKCQPADVCDLANRADVKLPRSFDRFMCSSELQSRVRSCTDCYLDPGERVVQTIGAIPGSLIHFLSDSQSCAHWYLHVLPNGDSAVLESEDLYGYRVENSHWQGNPACRLEKLNIASQDFAFTAPSFSEFLYRFWIENEIWFASNDKTGRPLSELELQYVRHYDLPKHKE